MIFIQPAIVQDMVMSYGPHCRILLCAMGQSTKPIITAPNYSFKGKVMLKSVCIETVITRTYTNQVLNLWYQQQKMVLCGGPGLTTNVELE
jgi:hypothetical protein